MVKPQNEYYIRFVLLLVKGGGEVLCQIVTWGLERHPQRPTLQMFLLLNKKHICRSERIKRTEIDILYPVSPAESDLSKWDISLLSFIALDFFKKDLNGIEVKAVETIRDMRNKYYHLPDAAIEFHTYNLVWIELTLIITTMAHSMNGSKEEGLKNLISNLAKEELDMSSAIEELKTMIHTDELLKSLGHLYSELKREIHEMRKELKEIKNMLESLGQSTDIRTTSRGVICVADDHIRGSTKAENLLFAASRDSLADSVSSDAHRGVKEGIDNLVDEVKHLGVATDKVDKGSVVFTFTCGSLTSLLDLIYFFEDGRIQKHLDEIGSKLETILGRKVKLTAHMQPEALRGVLSLIKTCTGYDEHQHALDMFERGSVDSSAESSTVGQAVDFEQIRRTIQSTRKDRAKGVRGLQTTSTEYESDTTGYDSESTYASPTPPLNRRSVVHCPGRLKDGSMCNTVICLVKQNVSVVEKF